MIGTCLLFSSGSELRFCFRWFNRPTMSVYLSVQCFRVCGGGGAQARAAHQRQLTHHPRQREHYHMYSEVFCYSRHLYSIYTGPQTQWINEKLFNISYSSYNLDLDKLGGSKVEFDSSSLSLLPAFVSPSVLAEFSAMFLWTFTKTVTRHVKWLRNYISTRVLCLKSPRLKMNTNKIFANIFAADN
jgi:hypothetical protein